MPKALGARHEGFADAVAPCPFAPLEAASPAGGACAVRSEAALHCLMEN
ncbi:UNVERIFIED_CONTAM: hypothetical protein RKD50_009604 [Streptomyces canus]|jgi:hypothetical protein